jgi:phosphinothricin acetyltransferase
VKIRYAVDADLPAVVDIYNAAVLSRVSTAQLEPVTVDSRRDWIAKHPRDEYPFWVAEDDDGRVVGWLTVKEFLPRCAYRGTAEVSVYVHADVRKRGIGRALLDHAVGECRKLGLTNFAGLIFAQNESSLRLFERAGFERWGCLPGVARIEDQPRDLIIVGRSI